MGTEMRTESFAETGAEALDRAIAASREHLLRLQHDRGYWAGELEADASVAAGYIPLLHFMGREIDPERRRKVVEYCRRRQNADGSWSSYYGGAGDVSVSVQVYFAMKLAGVPAETDWMRRACDFIRSAGGVARVNVFTKTWLALFGEFDWAGCPSVPPEVILLPESWPVNIYEFASWSRETIVALMLVLTYRPVRPVPPGRGVEELYVEPPGERRYPVGRLEEPLSWRSFFLLLDKVFKLYERLPVKPGRGRATQRALEWLLERQEADGSWGGIMLPWIYALYGLEGLGFPADHPAVERGLRGIEDFLVEDAETLRLQPATSPVWDTAWTILALSASGLPGDHPALVRAGRWLLQEEIRRPGDWRVKNPGVDPGCWAFEFENDFYPDLDDTPVVARALRRVVLPPPEERRKEEAVSRAVRWLLGMQGRDGGWAAFDRDNDLEILEHIPFADFMTPLDPTCPDVTAHVIEFLCEVGEKGPALARGMSYLRNAQEADGAWYGRWGVNYLYGTGLSLAGLAAAEEFLARSGPVGVPANGGRGPGAPGERDGSARSPLAESRARGIEWLVSVQHDDGGWGETCLTYEDPGARADGPSTASQTAWALLGLLSGGRGGSEAVERGVAFLLDTQETDGSWSEAAYTGTGFPRAFYLHYDLYRNYFPLLALSQYRALREGEPAE